MNISKLLRFLPPLLPVIAISYFFFGLHLSIDWFARLLGKRLSLSLFSICFGFNPSTKSLSFYAFFDDLILLCFENPTKLLNG
jgi:hypothetical protein